MQHYPRRWDWDASLVSLPYAALLATPVVALIALSASSFSCSFDLHPPGTTTCYQPLPLLSLYAPLRDSILRSRESTADGTARTTGRSLAGEEK
jgi:hypothetical protein